MLLLLSVLFIIVTFLWLFLLRIKKMVLLLPKMLQGEDWFFLPTNDKRMCSTNVITWYTFSIQSWEPHTCIYILKIFVTHSIVFTLYTSYIQNYAYDVHIIFSCVRIMYTSECMIITIILYIIMLTWKSIDFETNMST